MSIGYIYRGYRRWIVAQVMFCGVRVSGYMIRMEGK